MKFFLFGLTFLASFTALGKSEFKSCNEYLQEKVKRESRQRYISKEEASKVNIFKVCLKASSGFVECQKIVENKHGNNRFYLPVCLKAKKGISDCVEIYRKNFSHPPHTYPGENGLDSVIRICTGETELNKDLTIEWSDDNSLHFMY